MKRYGAVLYEGHNRMGLGTSPNLIALLTGETEKGDWLDEDERKLIHLVYREQGYLTLQMEDGAAMENFENSKFRKPPADIYYRPAFQAINEATELRCGQIGTWGNVFQYLQEKSLHEYQFDALHDFIEKYKTTPTFAFLHLHEYTHNDQNLARLIDEHLSSILGNISNIDCKVVVIAMD